VQVTSVAAELEKVNGEKLQPLLEPRVTLPAALRNYFCLTGVTPEEAFDGKHGEHLTPGHYWCNRTQTVVGVDDRPVQKHAGTPGRACFEE
jgi:hypothetical protein